MMKKYVISFFVFASIMLRAEDPHFYSQFGQDRYLFENWFKDTHCGTFIEIGAHDGISFSNTYFFEKNLGWHGICVEPIPSVFERLKKNRQGICIQGCISNFSGPAKFLEVVANNIHVQMLSGLIEKYDPKHVERIQREIAEAGGASKVIDVMCYTFKELIEEHNLTHINYLSIDTEGGEFDILKSIDFTKIIIDFISVEDNYNNSAIQRWLEAQGYKFLEKLGVDIIFQRITC